MPEGEAERDDQSDLEEQGPQERLEQRQRRLGLDLIGSEQGGDLGHALGLGVDRFGRTERLDLGLDLAHRGCGIGSDLLPALAARSAALSGHLLRRHRIGLVAPRLRLGEPQERCAVLFGATPRTGQKWANGEWRVPGAVALLLRFMHLRPEMVPVIEGLGAPPPRARRPAAKARGSQRAKT